MGGKDTELNVKQIARVGRFDVIFPILVIGLQQKQATPLNQKPLSMYPFDELNLHLDTIKN